MKFTAAVLAFAASLAFVGAQDLGDIPSCAIPCFVAALPSTGCQATDTKCQCTTGKDALTKSVTQCVPSKCSAQDQAKVLPAAEALCVKAGVSVSSGSPSATASAAVSSGASNLTATASGVRSSVAASRSASATGSAATQQSTGAAVANVAGMGAVVLGFAAALL